ncbi:hypothetical protein R1sor_017566 [Riccia sorocarpa]|uniref:CCHC-type domain-containing protein n=1 Tax=Riccia sorocarpa TaxID=122646 RepID=A0ABD3IDF8_9MARC
MGRSQAEARTETRHNPDSSPLTEAFLDFSRLGAPEVDGAVSKGTLYMYGKMVFLSQWTYNFNPTKIYANVLPVWLGLPRVHPLIEQYGDKMLDSIGEVLHKTIDKQTNQYSNISACVLVDLAASLMDSVDVVIYGEVVWSQVIQYQRLPDTCFKCQQRGHWIRECPKWREEEQSADPPDREESEIPDTQNGVATKSAGGEASSSKTGQGAAEASTSRGGTLDKDGFQQASIAEGGGRTDVGEAGDQSEEQHLQENVDMEMLNRFENEIFSPEQLIVEKRRVIDGEDEGGFRRQSLHPGAIQTRLFQEARDREGETSSAASQARQPPREVKGMSKSASQSKPLHASEAASQEKGGKGGRKEKTDRRGNKIN